MDTSHGDPERSNIMKTYENSTITTNQANPDGNCECGPNCGCGEETGCTCASRRG